MPAPRTPRRGIARLAVAAVAAFVPALLATAPIPAGAQGGAIEGMVVSALDGRPIAGATLEVSELRRVTQTDRHGRFRLTVPDVPSLPLTLTVQAAGYAAVEHSLDGAGRGAAVVIELERTVLDLPGVVATATPLGGGGGVYQATQSLGREQLQRRAATSFGEMLDGEPGVSMRSFGPAPGRPVIRGLDGDRVVVLENGERMGDLSETAADHAITADPLAADRIEVVRGPASLLYGSSALGGVINILSEDVPRSWAPGSSGSVAAQGATVNDTRAAFGRLVHGSERWAVTARGSMRAADDVRTPAGRLPGTHARDRTGSLGLAHAGDAFEGGVALAFLDKDYGIPEAIDDPHEEVVLRTDRRTVQARGAWRGNGLIESAELRIGGARYFHQEVERGSHPGTPPTEEIGHEWLRHTGSATLTLRLAPHPVLGAGAIGLSALAQSLGAGGADALTPDGRSRALAAFLYHEVPVAHALRVQLGARVEDQDIHARPNHHFPDADVARHATTVSGSLGANLRPIAGLEVGLQVARAHRAPLLEELFSLGPHLGTGKFEIGDASLRNEIGHGLDLVVRWVADRWHAEAAAFRNDVRHFIHLRPAGETDPGSGLPVYTYDAANAVLTGGELSAEVAVTPRVRLAADLDYVRGTRVDGDAAREPLPFMPPLRARLAVSHDPGPWFVGASTRLVGGQDRVAPDEAATPGYTLLAAEAGYRLHGAGRHMVTLRVDNVTNVAYRDHLSRVEGRDVPMPGRSFNLVYRWAF